MTVRSLVVRRVLEAGVGIVGAAAVVLTAAPASAKESKRAVCSAAYRAYKSGVEAQKAGQLRDAMASFATCAEATECGGLVPRCKGQYDHIQSDLPSVVPVVTDENGAPRVDVDVKVDGQPLTSHLDGKGLPVTPGLHDFTFATEKGVFATEKVMIVAGQRNREIAVSMGGPRVAAAPPAAPPAAVVATAAPAEPHPSDASPTTEAAAHLEAPAAATHDVAAASTHWAMPKSIWPYVIGGAGVAAVAAGGLLTYWGNRDNSTLESSCFGHCPEASLNHVKTLYVASDLSYGVGAVALGVSTVLFATSRATEPAPHPGVAVGVEPTRSGAFASVSGSF